MKLFSSILTISTLSIGLLSPLSAAPAQKRSGLDNDPDVIYLEHHASVPINLLLVEDTSIYASKTGKVSRKLGTLASASTVQLLAITENAYRISGKGKFGLLKGWVSPKSLASKDPNFVKNLQELYKRQISVNALIKNNQVAIGMSLSEVIQSLGNPTKKEDRITKDGRSGKYQFIKLEQQKHYRYITDPRSGQLFRQLSHVTTEERSNITVEFESNIVTSITSKEDNGPGNIKIVVPPIIFGF